MVTVAGEAAAAPGATTHRPGGRHWVIERLRGFADRPALVWRAETWSYARLCAAVDAWAAALDERRVAPGMVVGLEGDYSPQACALLLALLERRAIVVPLGPLPPGRRAAFAAIAEVGHWVAFDAADGWHWHGEGGWPGHPLLAGLGRRGESGQGEAGLVLFSSGSTGTPKASLLAFDRLLDKFREPRRGFRTLVFLLLDHIGGINTLFHVLCNGGTAVIADSRRPDDVCAAIARHRVELLPTTPTFLKMLLIAGAIGRHDLSTLATITYGTEPMPPATLAALAAALPTVRLKQTYGLSELGILSTRSAASDSLWLELGGDGFAHKVVDGVLWLKARSAMLGYLNAPSPFDAEGWFNTHDLVEVDGDRLRILGRRSELINVGGQKVHPGEVENVLLQMDNVLDATVRGQPNPVLGTVVAATLTLGRDEDLVGLKRRIRAFCGPRLDRYKIPMVVEIAAGGQHTERFKKARRPAVAVPA